MFQSAAVSQCHQMLQWRCHVSVSGCISVSLNAAVEMSCFSQRPYLGVTE